MPERSYPDRDTTLAHCETLKQEALSQQRFAKMETTLRDKAGGLTYQGAIELLISGNVDSDTRKVIVQEITDYVALTMHLTKFTLVKLQSVGNWDDRLLGLIVDLINHLKNTVLIVPICGLTSGVAWSLLNERHDARSRANLIQKMKKYVSKFSIQLLHIDEKLKNWAKSPTEFISSERPTKLGSSRASNKRIDYIRRLID